MTRHRPNGISVEQFCRRHALSKASLFILAHSHPSRIPDTVTLAGRLRILDPNSKKSEIYQNLGLLAQDLPAGENDHLTVEALCNGFGVDAEMLLRLTLAHDMPQVYKIKGRAVFPFFSVTNWGLRKRADFLQEMIR